MVALQYPIGAFEPITQLNKEARQKCIQRLKRFPKELHEFVAAFGDVAWNRSYRPNGWTAAQLVNHLADSHLHSYARFKHAVTEDTPTIKDYPEPLWAQLQEAQSADSVPASIQMLSGIHYRWVAFLEALEDGDFDRSFFHPETQTHHTLHTALAYYSWHCDHHLGHLKIIKDKA